MNMTFGGKYEGEMSCLGGEIIHYMESDYVIIPGYDGIDFIKIRSTRKRYRTDSEFVRFKYYVINTSPLDAVEIRSSLTVCKTDRDYPWIRFTANILTVASICGLGFIGMTYFKFEKIRNLPGRNLLNMCSNMAVSLSLWFFFSRNDDHLFCTTAAILSHYFWLATFFWMSVTGFDTWSTFRPKSMTADKADQMSLYYAYCTFAYGVPLVIVGVGVLATYFIPSLKFAYGGERSCWLINPYQVIATFLLPIGVITMSNVLFFVGIIVNICRVRMVSNMAAASHQNARDFLPYVKLPVLLGSSWLLGFLGSLFDEDVLWIIFDLMNGSQGVLLFFVFISSRRNRSLYGLVLGGKKDTKTAKRQTSSTVTQK